MKLNKKITAAMVTVAALFGSVAQADTVTGSFKVNTTVASTCVLEVANIAVGDFTAQELGVTTKNGSVSALCSYGVPYTIAFNSASGSNTAKTMTAGGADRLNYSLKSNQIGVTEKFEVSTVTGGLLSVSGVQNVGAKITFPLEVSIANNQYIAPGAYKDTITATLTY